MGDESSQILIMPTVEEKELLVQLIGPDDKHAAFAQLIKLYQRSLYFHIRRIVISHEDADDVLQNALLKAWKNLASFRAEASLKTWLYRIATNESLTFLKQRQRRSFQGIEDLQNDLRHSLSHGPYIDGDEIQMKLQKAILQLPERQRLVFNMRYFEELKYDEISSILEVTTGSLKASYHHAVKKVEKFLLEEM